MFFPSSILFRNTLLFRMYMLSCGRKSAGSIPVQEIDKCIQVLKKERISLNLWSHLALALIHNLFAHYKNIHQELLRMLKKQEKQPIQTYSYFLSTTRIITYPICPVFSCYFSVHLGVSAADEALEWPRTNLGSIQNTSLLTQSDISARHTFSSRKTAEKQIDTKISISISDIQIPLSSKWRNTPGKPRKTYAALKFAAEKIKEILAAQEDEHSCSFPSEIDISSIEAPRRYTFENEQMQDISIPRYSSVNSSFSSLHTISPAVTFFQMLIAISEGKITATQRVPYGNIEVHEIIQ